MRGTLGGRVGDWGNGSGMHLTVEGWNHAALGWWGCARGVGLQGWGCRGGCGAGRNRGWLRRYLRATLRVACQTRQYRLRHPLLLRRQVRVARGTATESRGAGCGGCGVAQRASCVAVSSRVGDVVRCSPTRRAFVPPDTWLPTCGGDGVRKAADPGSQLKQRRWACEAAPKP